LISTERRTTPLERFGLPGGDRPVLLLEGHRSSAGRDHPCSRPRPFQRPSCGAGNEPSTSRSAHHELRLVEGAEQVLPGGDVHARFAADRGVDHREQRGGHLDAGDASPGRSPPRTPPHRRPRHRRSAMTAVGAQSARADPKPADDEDEPDDHACSCALLRGRGKGAHDRDRVVRPAGRSSLPDIITYPSTNFPHQMCTSPHGRGKNQPRINIGFLTHDVDSGQTAEGPGSGCHNL